MESTVKFRPLYDRVVIKRSEQDRTTKAGIYIPDVAAEKPDVGQVIAAGPGTLLEGGGLRPLEVKPGDRVLFSKYAGQEVKIHGEEFWIVRETDVLGVLE